MTDVIALIGVGLTALGLFINAALFSFFLGKLSARVSGLEARTHNVDDSATALAAITATLHAVKDSVDDIKVTFARRFEAVEHTVKTLLMARTRA
jgi:sugar (pentulose or hexulose) kinase